MNLKLNSKTKFAFHMVKPSIFLLSLSPPIMDIVRIFGLVRFMALLYFKIKSKYSIIGYRCSKSVEVKFMIIYDNFWKTLKAKNISQYKLAVHYGVSNSQISRIKKGEHITTATLEKLCQILQCRVEDIITFVPDTPSTKNKIMDAVAEQPDSAYKQEKQK